MGKELAKACPSAGGNHREARPQAKADTGKKTLDTHVRLEPSRLESPKLLRIFALRPPRSDVITFKPEDVLKQRQT